jgi:hypothetical protein
MLVICLMVGDGLIMAGVLVWLKSWAKRATGVGIMALSAAITSLALTF